jgi:tripartite-type tricarboxylate transporter receptor subunit TctC
LVRNTAKTSAGGDQAFGEPALPLPALSQRVQRPDTVNTWALSGAIMKLPRRKFLHLAAGAAALPALSRVAEAQIYPTRPVRLVVGFPAGSGPDVVARLTGQWLLERVGQQFVVENRVGASSDIATELVARAAPDGYTLLQVTPANAINATLYGGVNFNRDIAPVAGVARASFVLVVDPSFPAKTVPEFIAYAKANPGKLNMGSSSTGSAPYMSGALFKTMTNIDILQVPYRGTPQAITELLGGRLQLAVSDMSSIEYIHAGTLRALAVTAATRQDALPNVPTVGDFVPSYEASSWYGLAAPKNTPVEIINRLNSEINAALADPKLTARLANLGFTAISGSPADFGKLIADETVKWGKVIRTANIKPE